MPNRFSFGLLLLGAFSIAAGADDNWPEFRGPTGDGRSSATSLPTQWSENQNVRWKTAIHDKGWSSPVIWDKQIWVTTATEKGDKLYAVGLDRETGKVLHDLLVFEVSRPDPKDPYHVWKGYNSYASPTPAIEEGHIYVHYGVGGTACIDTQTGKILWKRNDLPCNHHRGAASSPVLFEDLVILTFDGFDQQYLIALNKKTGETVWKRDRDFHAEKVDGDLRKAYSTPSLIAVGQEKQLVSASAGSTGAYNPKTGEEIWRVVHGGMNSSVRPVFAQGLVFTCSSDGGLQLVAIKPEGKGNITKSNIAWTSSKGVPNRSSPIVVDDKMFMVNSGGIVTCISLKDGKEINKTRLEAKGAKFSSSPILSEGKIFTFDENGNGYVVAATPELELIGTNKLAAGCRGSPAAVGHSLFARTDTHLYCLEEKK
jgi:outer membrane protein assembly factor BamB